MALLLMFVLSFSSAYADTDVRGEVVPGKGLTQESASDAEESGDKSAPEGSIVCKGKYLYYRNPNGTIRKKSGFVTVRDRMYYVRRGGRIMTSDTFRVDKRYYRANKHGRILTGVYKWHGKYYYSYTQGQWKRKAGFVVWEGNRYYVQDGGLVMMNEGFIVDNKAYVANKKGYVTEVEFSEDDDNAVIEVAREQVGIMTGKTYWVWYYRTKFVDTDRTPWCGAFVAWCYNEAGLYNKISVAKRHGPLGYVPSYSRYADSYNKWISRDDARAGDIIVFGRNRHVGIVEGIYGKYIVTIEGNAGPTAAIGCGKPGAVVRKIYRLNSDSIKGVICVLKHRKARAK